MSIRGLTDLERFQTKYEIKESGCWEWIGSRSTRYGGFHLPSYPSGRVKRMVLAHKASLYLLKGIVPNEGESVLHSCDNGFCVNPDHLSVGTQQDNMLDMSRKGRAGRAMLILDDEDAYLAVMLREAGFGPKYIQNYYFPNMSESQLSRITRGLRRD